MRWAKRGDDDFGGREGGTARVIFDNTYLSGGCNAETQTI